LVIKVIEKNSSFNKINTTLTFIISKKIDHEISFRKTEQEWKELEKVLNS
jgi:hypothetical protein